MTIIGHLAKGFVAVLFRLYTPVMTNDEMKCICSCMCVCVCLKLHLCDLRLVQNIYFHCFNASASNSMKTV